MMRNLSALFLGTLFLCVIGGCDTQARGETASATEAPGHPPTKAGAATADVARIVFVGKAQACDCTRTRIDTSWTALQAALGDSGPAVERLRMDTQGEQVEPYRQLRPMITLPGVYLLDAQGSLVELLQGAITEAQFRAALESSG